MEVFRWPMPRPRKALEIFLSVGVSAGVLGTAIQGREALAKHEHHPSEPSAQVSDQGGEGGEGGEAGHAATAQTDLDVQVVLAQMQGHLLVAQELLKQQQFSAAEPHVGHPVDELYGALEPALQRRQIPPFLGALEELRQQVRLNPKAPSTSQKLAKAQQAIAAAAQGVSGPTAKQVPAVVSVVRQLAQSAVDEYGAAVAANQVVEVIEYQDARGFLLEAQQLLLTATTSGSAPTPQLATKRQIISTMLKAFPTVMPPSRTVMGTAQLQQMKDQL